MPANVDIPSEPLHAAVGVSANRWPTRVAIDFFGATVTYAEFAAQVEKAAGALHALGVRPGDRVAIVVPNSASHIIAFYAALRLGAIAVELNPTYTVDELTHLLADNGAEVAVVWTKAIPAVLAAQPLTAVRHVIAVDIAKDLPRGKRLALRLPVPKARKLRTAMCGPVPRKIPDWHRFSSAAAPLPSDVPHPVPDDVALLLYTGGTTGTPQAAMLTHRNLIANVVQASTWVGLRDGEETVFAALPFFHAFGLTCSLTVGPQIGATMVVFPNFDPPSVLAAQRRRPATFIPGVAPMFDRLMAAQECEKRPTDMTSIHKSFVGAMPTSPTTVARWERLTGGLLVEGYGMTEASPIILGNPCSLDRRPGTLGLPFPSTDIRVVDQDDPTAPPEVIDTPSGPALRGELLARGPQVFQGYWNRPDATRHQLLDGGWLRTGDVVIVDASGRAVLVDRIKEMIITGGFKVYPSQVEDQLRTMPGVRDVAVVGVPGRGTDETVAAVVVLDEEGAAEGGHSLIPHVDLESLRAWGAQRLARYALPKTIAFVAELPRSQIGKVLRRVVRADLLSSGHPHETHPTAHA